MLGHLQRWLVIILDQVGVEVGDFPWATRAEMGPKTRWAFIIESAYSR